MGASFTILERLHRQCSGHRQALNQAERCGCFYCERTFQPSTIEVWVDADSTAVCPHCGIDSVVPESPQYRLTAELLHDMHTYWFERSVTIPSGPPLLQKFILRIEPIKRRISWLVRGNRAA